MKQPDPICRAIEDWTGHTEQKRLTRQFACWMVGLCALGAVLFLTSCEVLPTAKLADGSIITGGMTAFTRSQSKNVSVTHPNGLAMTYNTTGHDETIVPAQVASVKKLGIITDGATSLFRTAESTKRVLSGHEVSKHATSTAADVEKLKILNPVEEVIPAAVNP